MRDARYQAIWHEMNAAQVELIMAAHEEVKERRSGLVRSLEAARRAVVLLLVELAERESADG